MIEDVKKFLAVSRLAESTRGLYLYHLTLLAQWMDENNIKPRSLTADQLLLYLDSKKAWGSSSKNLTACAARAFWGWKYGPKHQVLTVRVRRDDPGPQRTMNKKEIEQLIDVFDTSQAKGVRDLALVMLMLDTGIRATEVCTLTMDNLDMGERVITVRIKGGSWEPGAFFEYTTACLENWLVIRKQFAAPGVKTVFVSVGGNTRGKPLTRDGLRATFRKLGLNAGLAETISPHALRRSFTTLALKAGAPSRTVQIGGRWADINMVERYSRKLQVKAMHPYSPSNYVMGVKPKLSDDD